MKKKSESIIDPRKVCHICGSERMLQKHHAIHGTANRRLADKDGLYVWLCLSCHMALHDRGVHDRDLQIEAEEAWIHHYGTEDDFRKRYGKSFISPGSEI